MAATGSVAASCRRPAVGFRPRAGGGRENYAALYKAYRSLFCEPGSLSMAGQMELHRRACDDLGIHGTADFVLWHRAFLHHHEKILSSVSRRHGGPPLSIPYWDWDANLYSSSPVGFAAANFKCVNQALLRNPLPVGFTRATGAKEIAVLRKAIGSGAAVSAVVQLSSTHIHQAPHNWIGVGNSNAIATAAYDPLFYAHHANLDRIVFHAFGTNIPCTNTSYEFIEPDGGRISTTLHKFRDMRILYEDDYPYNTPRFEVSDWEGEPGASFPRDAQLRLMVEFEQMLKVGAYVVEPFTGQTIFNAIDHAMTAEIWLPTAQEGVKSGFGVEAVPDVVSGLNSVTQEAVRVRGKVTSAQLVVPVGN